jgi:hypothetical protein
MKNRMRIWFSKIQSNDVIIDVEVMCYIHAFIYSCLMGFITEDPCSWRRHGSPDGGFMDPTHIFSTWSHDGKTEDPGESIHESCG